MNYYGLKCTILQIQQFCNLYRAISAIGQSAAKLFYVGKMGYIYKITKNNYFAAAKMSASSQK